MQCPAVPPRGVLSSDRTDHLAQTADGIVPSLLTVGVLYAVLVLRVLKGEPTTGGLVVAAIDGSLAACALAARAACMRTEVRAWVASHAQGVALALGLFASLDLLATLVTKAAPGQSGTVVIFLLAAGAIPQDRRYLAVVVSTVLAEWFAVAALHGFTGDWVPVSVVVVLAGAAAAGLQSIRRRLADGLASVQRAIRLIAVTDDMTGLANRRGLLEAASGLGDLRSPLLPVGVLVLDVDGLKAVNDASGHADGDRLLMEAAGVLRAAVRPGDVVARLGGDEFAVLLPGAPAGLADEVRARVLTSLERVGVSASIGVAEASGGQGIEQLLARADRAMYAVKALRPASRSALGGPVPRALTGTPGAHPAQVAAPTSGASQPAGHHLVEQHLAGPPLADLREIGVMGVVVHLLMLPFDLLLLPAGAAIAIVSLIGMMPFAALGVTLRHASWRRAVHARGAGVVSALYAVACAEAVAFVLLSGQMWTSDMVVLAVVATGGVVRSRSQVLAIAFVTTLAWGLAVATGHVPGDWRAYAPSVVAAPFVASLLNLAQYRTVVRLTAAQAQARVAAVTDELSGLLNRRGFLAAGRPLVERAGADGDDVGVLFLDLDGLKLVNDSRGHAAGDELIDTAAQVLRATTAPGDLCSRFGGDEFALLLHGCGPDELFERADSVHAALAASGVSASIGVARLGRDGATLEALIDAADAAMYVGRSARRAGRDLRPAEVTAPPTVPLVG